MLKRIIYMSILLVSMLTAATVNTDKDNYAVNQSIVVSFAEMEAQNGDWIGIYPVDSTNDWGNQVQWKWTDDVEAGNVTFTPLAAGTYEVRVFYNNSFILEASKQIIVDENAVVATVETNKNTYLAVEEIVATFDNMSGNEGDWIAIYASGSANTWANMLQWSWIEDDLVAGTHTFEAMPAGDYEVRVFFNNSFNDEAIAAFSVEENAVVTSVETSKDTYLASEEIVANFDNMSGNEGDWIAIYASGSANTWANMLQWSWIEDDLVAGTHVFEPMPAGDYEVRVFFNNSFVDEAVSAFSVEQIANELELEKEAYSPFELIHVNYNNMRGVESDWIGLFAVGANHEKESALEWRDAKSLVSGQLSFNGLPAGTYEARSYFDDVHQKTVQFTIEDEDENRIFYDDFEDGVIDPRWVRFAGPAMEISNRGVSSEVVGNTERKVIMAGEHSLLLKSDYRGGLNHAGYYFNFENPDAKLKFLEIDVSMNGVSHSSAFGVKVRTKFGDRRIEFASWLNHTLPSGQQIYRGPYGNVLPGHRQAFTKDNYLYVHPGPSDYTVGSRIAEGGNMFVHFKINIEEKLRLMEPDNELLGITLFISSGGYYDNLALTSQE